MEQPLTHEQIQELANRIATDEYRNEGDINLLLKQPLFIEHISNYVNHRGGRIRLQSHDCKDFKQKIWMYLEDLLKKRHAFHDGDFFHWANGKMRGKFSDCLKAIRRDRERQPRRGDMRLDDMESPQRSAAEDASLREFEARVLEFVTTLPVVQWLAFVKYFFEFKTLEEVSEETRSPLSTVGYHKNRALSLLLRYLKSWGDPDNTLPST